MERHKGYVGGGSFSDWILAYVWSTDYNLPRLPALAVHELHHKVRLAEAFAAEMFVEELLGPWSKALSEAELDEARPVMHEALGVTGFDEIRSYVFGDWAAPLFGYEPRALPDFVGYSSMGYRVVREYGVPRPQGQLGGGGLLRPLAGDRRRVALLLVALWPSREG